MNSCGGDFLYQFLPVFVVIVILSKPGAYAAVKASVRNILKGLACAAEASEAVIRSSEAAKIAASEAVIQAARGALAKAAVLTAVSVVATEAVILAAVGVVIAEAAVLTAVGVVATEAVVLTAVGVVITKAVVLITVCIVAEAVVLAAVGIAAERVLFVHVQIHLVVGILALFLVVLDANNNKNNYDRSEGNKEKPPSVAEIADPYPYPCICRQRGSTHDTKDKRSEHQKLQHPAFHKNPLSFHDLINFQLKCVLL